MQEVKEIHIATVRGFCNGVKSAIATVEKILEEERSNGAAPPIFLLHELVHNEFVVNSFVEKGVKIIEEPEEALLPSGEKGVLILSAHGVSLDVEKRAFATGHKIVDAACPIVRSLHKKAEDFSREGKRILLLGKRGHRETQGIAGRVKTPAVILENEEEVKEFLSHLSPEEKVLSYGCLSQTTLEADKVEKMKTLLAEVLPFLTLQAQVCFATKERQDAVKGLAEKCDMILVVGSEKSSNSRRLCECAREAGSTSLLVPDPGKLDLSRLLPYGKIGITSGASAPEALLEELVKRLLDNPFFEAELKDP